jgi:hypothetical protein
MQAMHYLLAILDPENPDADKLYKALEPLEKLACRNEIIRLQINDEALKKIEEILNQAENG